MLHKFFVLCFCVGSFAAVPADIEKIKCASVTNCRRNRSSTIETYNEYCENQYEKTARYQKNELLPKIRSEIAALNEDILKGDDACKVHLRNNPVEYYMFAVFEKCDGYIEGDDSSRMEEFNRLVSVPNFDDAIYLKYYCMVLVYDMNKICTYLNNNVLALERCDVKKAVDRAFRRKWLNCVKKAQTKN